MIAYKNDSLARLDKLISGFGKDCARLSSDLLPYVGTVATAKDMNLVLDKLGMNKIRYL